MGVQPQSAAVGFFSPKGLYCSIGLTPILHTLRIISMFIGRGDLGWSYLTGDHYQVVNLTDNCLEDTHYLGLRPLYIQEENPPMVPDWDGGFNARFSLSRHTC